MGFSAPRCHPPPFLRPCRDTIKPSHNQIFGSAEVALWFVLLPLLSAQKRCLCSCRAEEQSGTRSDREGIVCEHKEGQSKGEAAAGHPLARAGRAGRSAKYEEEQEQTRCVRELTSASMSRPRKPQWPGAHVGTSEQRRRPMRIRATDRRATTQLQATDLNPKPKLVSSTGRLLLPRPCVDVSTISLGASSRVQDSD